MKDTEYEAGDEDVDDLNDDDDDDWDNDLRKRLEGSSVHNPDAASVNSHGKS